ncbi:50S ribosomal protein L3 [Blattabacterium cuenoti]|uniref:50S ribosomal protein L3 n=1 Tax=Blattabacterium cuenoti TaxID=1653831 RepID=UPI00163BB172|nr:50S ribosomal protein L3 [Blattabacterium cuenoti]
MKTIGLIGKNVGMTNISLDNGMNVSCTIINVNTCYIIQIKTIKNDGYSSIQIGSGEKNIKNFNKSLLGHFKKSGVSPKKKLLEIKGDFDENSYKIGQLINVSIFNVGDTVNVTGISKGKGFQGVVKRHKFSGVGERSHGQHNRLRSAGSIGAGSTPSKVFKGKKMAGRMGNNKVTIKNLKILKIDIDRNLLIIKGSVPGNKNSFLMIKKKIWN